MRDEDEPSLEVVDGVGEGVDGLHVEVVGGLVEEQHVRRLPRQPREHHATPLPVGQLLDGARLQRVRGLGQLVIHMDTSYCCQGPSKHMFEHTTNS